MSVELQLKDARTQESPTYAISTTMHIPGFISDVAAPMVNQSDAPFRHLVMQHGASCAYTQMLLASTFLDDRDFREWHLRDIQMGPRPCVVQLGGSRVDELIEVAKTVAPYCDGLGECTSCYDPIRFEVLRVRIVKIRS